MKKMTDKDILADYDVKDFDKLLGYVPGNHKVSQLGSITLEACSEYLVNLKGARRSYVLRLDME